MTPKTKPTDTLGRRRSGLVSGFAVAATCFAGTINRFPQEGQGSCLPSHPSSDSRS
jgi:hypothetical protein